jgi:hypothetical protein
MSGIASIPTSSVNPCVPQPINATVIFSLGATVPGPPSTCLGTIVNAAADAAEYARNLRRLISRAMIHLVEMRLPHRTLTLDHQAQCIGNIVPPLAPETDTATNRISLDIDTQS